MSEKKARKSRIPQPFAYRGGWRAQVTLKNGTRPYADFTYEKEAGEWIPNWPFQRTSSNRQFVASGRLSDSRI
jgi:hypothetical protein